MHDRALNTHLQFGKNITLHFKFNLLVPILSQIIIIGGNTRFNYCFFAPLSNVSKNYKAIVKCRGKVLDQIFLQ